MKRHFKFYLPDGSVESMTDTQFLKDLGMTDEFIAERQQQEKAHYLSEMHNERDWRNGELLLTDKLMYPDSTYSGKLVPGSEMHDEIVAYRHALREYDLQEEERPVRPDWFVG